MRSTPQKGKPTGAGTTAGSTKTHTHALIVGQVADGLALTTTSEARVDSRTLAKYLGSKHQNLFELVKQHRADFEQLGLLRFQTGEPTGGRPEKFAMLNEEQSTLVLTYSRNSPRVRSLKVRLVKAFVEARRAADLRRTEYLPGYHAVHDQIKVLANGSPSERFDHMNINKLVNKVAGVEAGQRAAAPVPKQSLMIVSQMLIAVAIQPAKNSKEAYQLAAQAVQPLANVVLALGGAA
jgi:phage regulator Rha-like protein